MSGGSRVWALVRAGVAGVGLVLAVGLSGAGGARAEYVGGLDPWGDSTLALREGPGTQYRVLRRLKLHTHVTVLDERRSWLRLRLDDGTRGWAHSRYIYPGDPPRVEKRDDRVPPAGSVVHVRDTGAADARIPLRMGPKSEADVIRQLRPGTALTVLGQTGIWLRVSTADGTEGYVRLTSVTRGAGPDLRPGLRPDDEDHVTIDARAWAGPRFGTRLTWRADLFRQGPSLAGGDGITLISREGDAEAIVFAEPNSQGTSLRELRDQDLQSGLFDRITAERREKGWYVLRGRQADRILYRKVLLPGRGGVIHVFEMSYPAGQRDRWDPVLAEMVQSFRVR